MYCEISEMLEFHWVYEHIGSIEENDYNSLNNTSVQSVNDCQFNEGSEGQPGYIDIIEDIKCRLWFL